MNMKVGFIGLGVMGAPMARNLLAARMEVVGFNRTASKAAFLAESHGGAVAASPADAARDADVIVTMLPDSPDVEAVLTGEGGVLAAAKPGALVLEMSTIRPDVAVRMHDAARAAGVRMLDAPVSGGEAGAVEGSLSIMIGGAADDVVAARPVLDAVGKTIVHVGGPGSGQTVKAANQLLVASHLQALSEALVFLDAHGVELSAALEVLGGGLAGSTVIARKGPSMLANAFGPGFRVELHHKDLGIYRDAARKAEVFSPVGAVVTELMASLRASGGGGLDHSALLTQVDALSGRTRWAR
jgi:2-hydroxy-3-oxopropionate reductase